MNPKDILRTTFLICDFQRPHLVEELVIYTFLTFQSSTYPDVHIPYRNNRFQVHLVFPVKNSTMINSITEKKSTRRIN